MDAPSPRQAVTGCAIAAAMGLFLALLRLGPDPLDPTDISWLLGGFDSTKAFLGWHHFRGEPWSWPPGLIRGYLHPIGSSVGLTDSVPLLALLLKPFDAILPTPFQYQGWWLYANHVLMGVFGYLALRAWTREHLPAVIGAAIFVLSPILASRIQVDHDALSAYWLVIAALWLYEWTTERGPKVFAVSWAILGAVSALVHPYLCALVIAVFGARVMQDVAIDRATLFSRVVTSALVAAVVALGWWLSGLLSFDGLEYGDAGFGYYAANLNSLFNPQNTSAILPGLPVPGDAHEAYSYLGLGVLLALLGSTVWAFRRRREAARRFATDHWALLLVAIGLFAFALSNTIAFNDHVLLRAGWEPWARFGAVFRASGRFAYLLHWVCIIVAVVGTTRALGSRATLGVVMIVALQLADLDIVATTARESRDAAELRSDRWSEILRDAERIVQVPPFEFEMRPGRRDAMEVSLLAANHRIPASAGWVSRAPARQMREFRARVQGELGSPAPGTVYLLDDIAEHLHGQVLREHAECEAVDGYWACRETTAKSLPVPKFPRSIELADLFEQNSNNLILAHATAPFAGIDVGSSVSLGGEKVWAGERGEFEAGTTLGRFRFVRHVRLDSASGAIAIDGFDFSPRVTPASLVVTTPNLGIVAVAWTTDGEHWWELRAGSRSTVAVGTAGGSAASQ